MVGSNYIPKIPWMAVWWAQTTERDTMDSCMVSSNYIPKIPWIAVWWSQTTYLRYHGQLYGGLKLHTRDTMDSRMVGSNYIPEKPWIAVWWAQATDQRYHGQLYGGLKIHTRDNCMDSCMVGSNYKDSCMMHSGYMLLFRIVARCTPVACEGQPQGVPRIQTKDKYSSDTQLAVTSNKAKERANHQGQGQRISRGYRLQGQQPHSKSNTRSPKPKNQTNKQISKHKINISE